MRSLGAPCDTAFSQPRWVPRLNELFEEEMNHVEKPNRCQSLDDLEEQFRRFIWQRDPTAVSLSDKYVRSKLNPSSEKETCWIASSLFPGMAVNTGMSEHDGKESGGQLLTFGSYRLGVVSPVSDIDAVCVAPSHTTREMFFESFVEKLQEQDNVKEVQALPDAYTPIVKLQMNEIDIDLLFARLAVGKVRGEIATMDDSSLLKDMDDKSVRCINGLRVAAKILEQIQPANLSTFETVLRFIKFWARRRGIYSNVIGFFGGITWSIMVAKLFQLYPNYSSSQMVAAFFSFYNSWAWGWRHPVQLCEPVDSKMSGLQGLKVWNPKSNPGDRVHVAPVVTPSFPAMNSTHNVTETTKRIIQEQFKHAYEVTNRVLDEKDSTEWKDVYNTFPFFTQFRHFLLVEMTARTEEPHNLRQRVEGTVAQYKSEYQLRVGNGEITSVPPGGVPFGMFTVLLVGEIASVPHPHYSWGAFGLEGLRGGVFTARSLAGIALCMQPFFCLPGPARLDVDAAGLLNRAAARAMPSVCYRFGRRR
eukprot:gene127-218_t